MKKLLMLCISLLTLTSLVNCGNQNQPSSNISSSTSEQESSGSSSSAPLFTYKEVGTKTETSLTVKFYVNLPNDDSLYRTHYVEPGEKISVFACVVRGYYGSLWYYDRYGTQLFDFENTPITEDLELYGYPQQKMFAPEETVIEEEGEFNLTWVNSPNCSFEGVDETLPYKADSGEVVKFKIRYALTALNEAEVKVDGKVITPDENGIYTLNVSKDHVIQTGEVNVSEDPNAPFVPPEGAPTSGYALWITSSEGEVRFEVLTHVDDMEGFMQYFGDDVQLNVGDCIKLYDGTNSVSWVEDTLSPYGQYDKFEVTSEGIVCLEENIYDIYVKFKYQQDEIYIGDSSGK